MLSPDINVTLEELENHWSFDDMVKANFLLDLKLEAEMDYQDKIKKQTPKLRGK